MEMKETVRMMLSYDYKERFIAEYLQTKERYERLKKFNNKIEAARRTGKEEPKHDCPLSLLREQQRAMGEYLHILEVRAEIEEIDLNPSLLIEDDTIGKIKLSSEATQAR